VPWSDSNSRGAPRNGSDCAILCQRGQAITFERITFADVIAGSGHLRESDLVELERRVEAHRSAVDALVEALETEPADDAEGVATDTESASSEEDETGAGPQTSRKAGIRT
jgi:hypothetical protein